MRRLKLSRVFGFLTWGLLVVALCDCKLPTSSSGTAAGTIVFNATGGIGSMSNQSIAVGATANLTSNSFTYTGYSFNGWNIVDPIVNT